MGRKGIKNISKNRIFSRDTLSKLHTDNLIGIYIGKQQSQIGLGLDTATVKEILGKADKIQKATTTQKKKKVATKTWYYKDLDTSLTFTKADKTYTLSSIIGGIPYRQVAVLL